MSHMEKGMATPPLAGLRAALKPKRSWQTLKDFVPLLVTAGLLSRTQKKNPSGFGAYDLRHAGMLDTAFEARDIGYDAKVRSERARATHDANHDGLRAAVRGRERERWRSLAPGASSAERADPEALEPTSGSAAHHERRSGARRADAALEDALWKTRSRMAYSSYRHRVQGCRRGRDCAPRLCGQ